MPSVAPHVRSDAAVDTLLDAALGTHRFLAVTDFTQQTYLGLDTIVMPGLPAYDAATSTLAVAFQEDDAIGTIPNVTIYLLAAADARKRSELPVWTVEQSSAALHKSLEPAALRDLMTAIDKQITAVEPKLATFTTIPACAGSDLPRADTDPRFPYCAGHEVWTCGNVVATYPQTKASEPFRDRLIVNAAAKTRTIAARDWRKPKLRVTEAGQPTGESIDTFNCIHDARLIPGTRNLLVELRHTCNTKGDDCSAGGPTWHVVAVP